MPRWSREVENWEGRGDMFVDHENIRGMADSWGIGRFMLHEEGRRVKKGEYDRIFELKGRLW